MDHMRIAGIEPSLVILSKTVPPPPRKKKIGAELRYC